ncbi:SycD/LcrH family type III secretion system chaperone [Roseiconus lacunae]|uniref:SycD/LcrH family type III secretion system chaperone n=1 Tax=Roseiconus lacunae TaxID=2605694 RepID=UPI001E5A0971|nr:SycD/LcrH family type III secretion system chaperone [Roseiconus lacunae]MCD0457894.1 SycD/LcrH family type III secretion system chaperone [Roseiconus lacunae]
MPQATDSPLNLLDESFEDAFLHCMQVAGQVINDGHTMQHAYQIQPEHMNAVYAYGYDLQQRGQFVKAEPIFRQLAFLDHYQPKYWIALGYCRERQKQYQDAMKAYVVAGRIDPADPCAALRAAECLMLMKEFTAASDAVELAIRNCQRRPQQQDKLKRAQFLQRTITKRTSLGTAS